MLMYRGRVVHRRRPNVDAPPALALYAVAFQDATRTIPPANSALLYTTHAQRIHCPTDGPAPQLPPRGSPFSCRPFWPAVRVLITSHGASYPRYATRVMGGRMSCCLPRTGICASRMCGFSHVRSPNDSRTPSRRSSAEAALPSAGWRPAEAAVRCLVRLASSTPCQCCARKDLSSRPRPPSACRSR